jgi:hypothetical protein
MMMVNSKSWSGEKDEALYTHLPLFAMTSFLDSSRRRIPACGLSSTLALARFRLFRCVWQSGVSTPSLKGL